MQDGTFIYLPDISLSVAKACSGVNFFISVTAIGVLLAYLTQKSWKRVGVVLVAGGAVTILANGIRVALAGTMGQEYGVAMLHGPGHILRGWFVAQVGWVGIFFINWLIAKIPHPSSLPLYERWREKSDTPAGTSAPADREAGKAPLVVLVVFLVCFGGYLNFYAMPRQTGLSVDLAGVPLHIGQWKGRAVTWLKSKKYFPGVNQEILRNYRTPSGRSVYLYVGYFTHQAVDARLVSYHARPLFKNTRKSDIAVSVNDPLQVNLSTPVISSVPYKVLSWYQFVDGELADARKAKIKGIVDALIHRRNNGAVILVALPASGGDTQVGIPDDLAAFSQLIAPILQNIIKGSHMGSM
jgi:EpsI family protein